MILGPARSDVHAADMWRWAFAFLAFGILPALGPATYGSLSAPATQGQQSTPPATVGPSASLADPNLTPQQQTAALKEEEIELAGQLLKDFPGTADPLVLMGNVLGRQGKSAEAIEFWSKAIALNPKRGDVYCSLGKVSLGKGEYDQAIEFYQEAMRIDGAASEGFAGLARALMAIGEQDRALEELKRSLELAPRHVSGHELIAELYMQRQQYEEARDHYETAAELQPNYTGAYYGLMSVYSRLKQPEKARENMAIFKRLKAEDMKVLKDRNEAYDDLLQTKAAVAETYASAQTLYQARGDINRAYELLSRGLAIDPNNVTCLDGIGFLYLAAGHLQDALTAYTRMAEIDPDSVICHLNVGIIHSRMGRPQEAEASFHKAVSLAPTASDPYRELARLYLRFRKDLPGALEMAQKAVDLEKKGENYFILAWACDLSRNMPGALAALERAIQLEPDNVRYKQAYEQAKKRN